MTIYELLNIQLFVSQPSQQTLKIQNPRLRPRLTELFEVSDSGQKK